MDKRHFVPPNGGRRSHSAGRPTAATRTDTTRLSLEWRCQHQMAPTTGEAITKTKHERNHVKNVQFNCNYSPLLLLLPIYIFLPGFLRFATSSIQFNSRVSRCADRSRSLGFGRTQYSCSRFAASEALLSRFDFVSFLPSRPCRSPRAVLEFLRLSRAAEKRARYKLYK